MERNIADDYVRAVLLALHPKLNEVLSTHELPEGASRSELVEILLAVQVKAAFDFAEAQNMTALEFLFLLRKMADKLEQEIVDEMRRISAEMDPEDAGIDALVDDALEAEKQFDREIKEAENRDDKSG